MKSYLYSRISTLQQSEGFGNQRQINTVTDFLSFAEIDSRLGFSLDPSNYEILESDLGKSAFTGRNWKPSSSLGRFYESVMRREIIEGILIVENIDRLTRQSNYEAARKLINLITNGITIIEVESGMCFSTKIPESLSILNMSISRAHGESLRKSRMIKKSWDNKKVKLLEQGIAPSKKVPRWLKVIDGAYVVDEVLAALFREAFVLYDKGHGNAAIVARFNSEGRLNNGKQWTTITMHRVLRDKRLNGIMTFGKNTDRDNEELLVFPVVVENELFNRVQEKINGKTKYDRTTKSQKNLFKGMLKCSLCKQAILTTTDGSRNTHARCIGRRDHKNCTARGFIYMPFERGLLKYIRGINWSSIYNSGVDNSQAIENCNGKISTIDFEINELTEELKAADDDVVLALVRTINNKKKTRKSLNDELELLTRELPKVDFDNVKDNLHDPSNVKERQHVNIELQKVVKEIRVLRMSDYVFVNISYYTGIVIHMIALDMKGNLITTSSIDENLMFHSDFIELDLLNNKMDVINTTWSEVHQLIWDLWSDIFDEALEQAKGMFDKRP
ncbi:recombinase family protein [Serratia marcescens]|uniref:recombinase family protein n=1 Tax=Serratia marcescens TaxID=615 RepID=UPI003EC529BA